MTGTEQTVRPAHRIRSDRVLRGPRSLRTVAATGRPPRHGPDFALSKPGTWRAPVHTTTTETTRHGRAVGTAWDGLSPRLTHRGVWAEHPGELPIIAGTLLRLQVERLPGEHAPKPVCLWSSVVGATAADVDRWWQGFLRRFDLEHTFRLFKQTPADHPAPATDTAPPAMTWANTSTQQHHPAPQGVKIKLRQRVGGLRAASCSTCLGLRRWRCGLPSASWVRRASARS